MAGPVAAGSAPRAGRLPYAGRRMAEESPERMSEARLRTEVLIAGAGLTGLTAATAFASAGIDCRIVDPAAGGPRSDARTTAVTCGSQRLYAALGVWRALRARTQPIRRIRVAEDDVPLFLHFECDDLGEGPVGHIVRNDDLSGALRARLETLGVPPAACAVEAFEEQPGGVRTQLSDGSVIDSRILIGADGRASPVRDLAGIGTRTHAYRQTAMVCTIRHTEPHHDTAVERFFPAGPFAVLPMRGRRSAIVWTEPHRIAARLMQLPATDFQVELAARFDGMFGTPTVEGPPTAFPLSLVLAKRHVQGRVVLVGDAAHALHPIAGQGFNLGLRGVALLAELAADHVRLGLEPGDPRVLAEYAGRRRIDTATLVTVTDGVNRLFSNGLPGLGVVRALGLGMVNSFPPVKQALMRQAMGIAAGMAGPLPRLIRGEPI